MDLFHLDVICKSVALLAEGVDRNEQAGLFVELRQVALLAEGVDRNIKRLRKAVKEPLVALLAEGVDRNHTKISDKTVQIRRPPRGGRG